MVQTEWRITEHRGLAAVSELESDWRRLYNEMDNPSAWHLCDAFAVYAETLCMRPDQIRLLALRDEKRVRAILPVEERIDRGLGVPVRVWALVSDPLWSPTDAIGPEDDAREVLLPAALAHLRTCSNRPAVFVMGPSRSDSRVWRGLADDPRMRFEFRDGAEFSFPTDMTFEEFEMRMTRNRRKRMRSLERSFGRIEESRYVYATEPEDVAREFEHLLVVEASGWKARSGTAIRQQGRAKSFYRGLVTRLREDGRCEVHALHVGDECIAADLAIRTRTRLAGYKIGYDERYAHFSPGILVVHKELIAACADPDIVEVSGVSDAPWMERWQPEVNELRRAYIALRPAAGPLLVEAYRLRYGPLRRAVRRARTLLHSGTVASGV